MCYFLHTHTIRHRSKIIEKSGLPVTFIQRDDDYIQLSWQKEGMTIPNIKLKIIENAGHCLWLDRPQEFKKNILLALENIQYRKY